MQRKKSRQVSLGIAVKSPTVQEVAQAEPWGEKRKRKEKRKSPSAPAPISIKLDLTLKSHHQVESGDCGPSVTESHY